MMTSTFANPDVYLLLWLLLPWPCAGEPVSESRR